MAAELLDLIRNYEVRHFAAGEIVLEQDQRTGLLLFLIEGTVEVVKDGVSVATSSQPGAVFGELAALLGSNHTATVQAVTACSFHVIDNPRALFESTPRVCLHVCELLARRLNGLNNYLVNVKQQYGGDDHLGMVDGVLETLMNRQPPKRVRPKTSTLRDR